MIPGKDDRTSPRWLIDEVERCWGDITFDPCSNPWSQLTCQSYSKHNGGDGLEGPWPVPYGNRLAYVNPPFSAGSIVKWVRKCREEHGNGWDVVMLVPLDPTTAWCREAWEFFRPYAVTKRVNFGEFKQTHRSPMQILATKSADIYLVGPPVIFLPLRSKALYSRAA